jgi:LemA protein
MRKQCTIGLLGLFTLGFVGCGYNQLVSSSEQVTAAWAEVESQMKRRYDLVPNLVETVKGYAKHEKELFTNIAEARAKLAGATKPSDRMKAAGEMEGLLSRLLVIVENYPQLKADQSFRALQDELAGTENRLAVARRRYNESVRDYNVLVRRFPTLFVAKITGFQPKDEYTSASEEEKTTPKVRFE